MKSTFMAGVVLVLATLIPLQAAADFEKTKIAVLDFDMQGESYQNQDMGAIVAEWLITALVKEGRFDVIERRLLKKVLSEHQLSASGIVNSNSAAELGKVLGVKIIISGAVMHFQNFIEVNARIIDVTSGSIIAAESVKSTTTMKLEELVIRMAEKIIKDFPLQGYVVRRKENTVSIDLGRMAGVKEGMTFIAYKEGSVIKHPVTGEVLEVEIIETGKLLVRQLRDKISHADILEEATPGSIQYGQQVKSLSEPLQPRDDRASIVSAGPYAELAEVDPMIEEVRQLKQQNNPQWEVKYKLLFAELERIYASNPTAPEVFFYFARAAEAVGDIRHANKYIEKAVYYNPEYIQAYEFQGDMNYEFGRTIMKQRSKAKLAVLAEKAYLAAVGVANDSRHQAMLYYKIGRVHQELSRDPIKADWYMQKAISTAPGSEAAKLAQANAGAE